jgi:hypothetical protein
MHTWLKQLLRRAGTSPIPGRRKSRAMQVGFRRPALDALEERRLLAIDMVTSNLDDGSAGTLRSVIAGAASGDTVEFNSGISSIDLTQGQIEINKSLTLAGPGAGLLIINQTTSGGARLFQIHASDANNNAVSVSMSGLTLTGGHLQADYPGGGCIYSQGNLTLDAMTLSGNSDTSGGGAFGGALSNVGGTLTVADSTLSNNSVAGGVRFQVAGGAIFNFNGGALTVTDSTISDNSVSGGAELEGGGIENVEGTMTVTGSTLSGNSAQLGGGIVNGGTATVTECTLSGNSATGIGGGIVNGSNSTLTVADCTISGNSANVGGGIFNLGNPPHVANTIIAGNTESGTGSSDPDVSGIYSPTDHNLIGVVGDATGFTGANGSLVGTSAGPIDPLLGPLQNNGGPTQTMALLPGSPAIDAGDDAPPSPFPPLIPATDQRGFARFAGVIDIGAFESQLSATAVPVAATEGAPFSGVVGSFSDLGQPSNDFTALVTWGDGATSDATVVHYRNGFNLLATHTFAEDGQYTMTLSVVDADGNSASAIATATVADAALTPVARPATATIAFTEGQDYQTRVASFEDADPRGAAGDYAATISWGDGATSTGTVVAGTPSGSGAVFDVTGDHTYSEEGASLPIRVTISDGTGNVVTATAVATVGLPATNRSLTVTGGKNFNGLLANFSDAGLSPSADFTASINWGDGATSTGTVTPTSVGNYKVSGSHQFSAFNGAKAITVTIVDADNGVSTVVSDPIIDPPAGPPSATANQSYVAAAYLDLFGQAADNSTVVAGTSLAAWAAQLDAGQLDAGASRAAFAAAIVHSADYYASIIRPIYEHYLGREPDAAGLNYWVSQMQAGLTDERLEAGFIGSAEFYAHAGGTDKLWVDFMYQDLLGRAADSAGESYWVAQLTAGANRSSVAFGFAASLERERMRVQDDYFHYLGRQADSSGVDYWVAAFAQGTTNEDVIAGFIASDEYFTDHTG